MIAMIELEVVKKDGSRKTGYVNPAHVVFLDSAQRLAGGIDTTMILLAFGGSIRAVGTPGSIMDALSRFN